MNRRLRSGVIALVAGSSVLAAVSPALAATGSHPPHPRHDGDRGPRQDDQFGRANEPSGRRAPAVQPRQGAVDAVNVFAFYSVDGTGNNIAHPTWGAAGTTLMRLAPAKYGDGISTPAGASRPSARVVSNALSAQTADEENARHMSDFVYVWGQFLDHDIDPFMKAAASGNAQEVDLHVVDEVRNFLFGAPGQGGMDLASLNIQRGRDHGLADYNTTRASYGLPKVTSFAQITSNTAVQDKLKTVYGSVDDIDLWVGVLAEDHVSGSSLGQLAQRMMVDQFSRLRDGDRMWFENIFTGQQLDKLEGTRLSDVIQRNTALTSLQPNVFFFTG